MAAVPASAHFPVGYNYLHHAQKISKVPASAHFPVGYNASVARGAVDAAVPASAHFPVGYNPRQPQALLNKGSS